MNMQRITRLLKLAAVALVFVAVAACTFRLRTDGGSTNVPARVDAAADPSAAKLAACRSVTYEQKEALSECRKAWAEKRRQLFAPKASSAPSRTGASQGDPSLTVPPQDGGSHPSSDVSLPSSRGDR